MIHLPNDTEQPWSIADATRIINAIARDKNLDIVTTHHYEDRMLERGLIMRDALHVLKMGFVYDAPEKASRGAFYKYCIASRTPNSGNRDVKVIVIPNQAECRCKLITIMWKDEK